MSFTEWSNAKKKKREEASSQPSAVTEIPSTPGSSGSGGSQKSFTEWSNEKRQKRGNDSAQGWASEAKLLLEETQRYFGSWHGKDDEEYNSIRERNSSLLAKADSWRKQYAGNDEAISYIDEVVSALSKARQTSRDYFDYYSQWDTEDDYKKWDAYQTPEGRKARYANNQARIAELKEERKKISGGGNTLLRLALHNAGAISADEFLTGNQRAKEIDKEIAAIESEMRMYERGNTDDSGFYYGSKVVDDYGDYAKRGDFGAVSSNRNFRNADRYALAEYDAMADSTTWHTDANNNIYDAFGNRIDPSNTDEKGNILHPLSGSSKYAVTDRLGLYLSASDADKQEALGTPIGTEGTWESIIKDGYDGNWELLEKDEVDVYYYLLNNSGQETADKYLSDMKTELNRRNMQQETTLYTEKFAEADTLERIALSIATTPAQMISGAAGFIEDAAMTAMGKDINPYSAAHGGMNFSQTVRGEQAEAWDEATGGTKIPFINYTAGDLYQSGMSFVDTLVGKKLGARAYEVLMGMGAASTEAKRLYEQGASNGQIAWGGALAGAAEIVFEHASIESLINLKDADTVGQFVKNLLIQGGIESTEEGFTDIANTITNAIVMGSESDWAKLVEEHGGNRLAAFIAKVQDVGKAAFGGFVSGSMGGAGHSAASYAQVQAQNAELGQYISGAKSTDALVALAQEMARSASGRDQKRLTAQSERIGKDFLTEGGKNRATGRLYNTVRSVVTEQNVSEISSALQEKGISKKDAAAIADAIAVQANGLDLSDKQQKVLDKFKSNEEVQGVLNEILDNQESGINQRAKSVAKFEFGAMRNHIISQMEQSVAEQKNATEVDKVDAPKENDPESRYEVSAEGKTILKSTGDIVTIKEVADTKDGKMILRLQDGSTVSAEDVSFGSAGEALIYETVAQMGASVKAANILVNGFKAVQGDTMSAQVYAHGISEAFRYGKLGLPMRELANSDFASKLNKGQQEYVYRQGQKAAGQQIAKDQATVNRAVQEAKNSSETAEDRIYQATLEDGISVSDLNESQKASYRLADQVAQAAKVNVRVYVSKTGEHGYYNYDTDEIYLNLNATNKSRKSMMAFTLGHELVHRAKKGSPAKYEAFANFLMEQYGKQGANVEDMIAQELAAAKQFNIKMSYEKAFEEVVCDACQRMLLDTNAGQKLAEFGAQSKENKSFLEDLKRWIKEFMDKLRSIFEGVEPDSMAAQEFAKFDESVKQILADMYVDMTIDAGENLSTIQNAFGKGTVVETNEHGEFTMAQSADGSEKVFNLVTWNNGGRETLEATLLREGYTEEEVKAALTIMDEKQRLVESIASELNDNGQMAFPEQGRINEATLTTDLKDGHSVLSALVSNGDYPVNIDLLMVCKKRKAYQRVINRLCETGMIKEATVDALAIAEINKILGKYGFETACLGCFVESRRLRIQEWAQTIVKEWNAEVKKRNPNAKAFGFGKGETTLTPDEVMQLVGELESGGAKNDQGNLNLGQGSAVKRMGVLLDKVPSLRRTLSIEDLITPDGLSSLRSFDSNLFSMVKSRYGSNSPKFVQEFNPYNHELAKYGKVPSEYKSLREYLYAIGGARMQSFSDFIIENWFDYCQIVADLAARKLPMHTYTKEISLAKLFGLTGIKINMSLIPDVDKSLGKEYAGLTRNAKGELELIWADKDRYKSTGGKSYMQSINFADAMELQNDPRYSANVGTIAVGISDMHIQTMLDDARIRMIIPYHSSGMNPIFADLMGTSYYKDYTNFQNTTVKQMYDSNGKKVSLKLDKTQTGKLTSGFQFNEVLQELGDARAAAEAYKEWCADASLHTITIKGETYTAELTPKFDDFSGHENYYKLLEDFNTYDCISEQAAPQGDVQQIYPEGFEDILRAELSSQEGHRQKQEKNQAFDKAMGEIEGYLKDHSKADTVHYANQHGIKLGAKDKKLNAADKAKLKKLQEEGASFSLPKESAREARKADIQSKVTSRYKMSVDQVLAGTYNSKDNILMGYTPDIFTRLGMPSLPFVIGPGHVYTATVTEAEAQADPLNRYKKGGHYHGLGVNTVKNLYSAIQDPIMIIAAKDIANQKGAPRSLHSVVAIVDVGDATEHLLLPVELTATRIVGGNRMDVNVLSSSYKRSVENLVEEAVAQMYAGDVGVYYAKKEATALLSGRVSFPKQLTEAIASNGIVHRFTEKVNMAISDVTQSLQFTNWFGDWQNDPQHSSKVVNDDGTPMIVYHGTKSGNIKTFRTINKNGTGGLFLSTNRSVAQGFAGANGEVYENYVNIRNPFIVDADVSFYDSIAIPDEMKGTKYAFGKTVDTNAIAAYARAAGYDGVIIKNVREPSGFGDDIIAFESTQVKSVDNIGTFDKTKDNSMYKLPVGEDTSPRALLSNAFETIVTNPIEKQKLQEYKDKIDLINAEERKLSELRAQIKELSFAKGPKDTKKIRDLQFEANQTANRINTYDKLLLGMEASKPLQNILNREKEMVRKRAEQKNKEALAAYRERVAKTQRELLDRWQDSRKKGIDSRNRTAMRHKIKDVVNELNQYLLKGTKDRHVPIGLQKAVAEALNAVNMDTVGAEERIAKLNAELMKAKTPEAIQEISKKIEHIREMGDRLDEKLKRLKTAYDEFINSDDPLIANSHDDAVSAHMMKLIVRVGDTPLREMTVDQLQDVYDVYKVVLATIRNANKSFKDNKNREISTRANQVMAEIDNLGVKRGMRIAGFEFIEKFGWDGLKPVYAMEHIGSQGLIDAYNNVRAGEDVWAKNIVEAREYYLEKFRDYGYDSWDFEKKLKFTSTTGKDFDLTLDQIMSLYAYSKRDQAADHLKYGGIVYDPKTEVVEKTKHGIKVKYNVANATAYNISEETLADIISKLTPEQKGFVDEMQTYLSDVMGAKGNEVSLAMYDVKLFREKHYFPLKSAHQYMAKAKEQAQGEVKIKNSGFSKETKPHAKNPIVLSSFMDVWTSHVNEMSMYHAFVLPMEDFYRIYNYTTPSKNENMPTEGVTAYIENAYGSGATEYIEQMLKDLNGGARSDSRTGFINKMMGLFKKGAVFASLSVVVQQPSAIARAAALVDTKYFIGPKVDHKRHKALWDEVKQYAPVAIIKEMGYFDTNMGKSTQDFIMGQEYSGFSEKMKALVTDSNYRDEILSKAPALADEIAWCSIWEAVKRETKAKNPGMDAKSDAFLQKAGERFTEVITKTQVYDSVLSRSALMRSKDTGMKMATAFMAEPTTSINMVADALLKGKRGDRKYARTAIGAVVASQIINSILVSFVYAGRDDDEDETYWEKYIGTLSGEILDSLNPAGYIPFIKDIVSIVQGYDVERSDMAVVSDLWNAWQNLSKDNVSVYRKVEGFVGSIAQIFGLPVKNIMRDARGICQTIMSFMNGQKTTKAGIVNAVKGAVTGKTVSDQQQLYEAIINGDNAQISRVKSRFKDQSAVNSAIRKALRENDPRIREAAIAWNANDLDEYMRIAREIIAEKHFVQDDVVMAIRSEANALAPDEGTTSTSKAKGLFTAEKFAEAIAQGDQATANAIKTDIIQTAQKNGKTADEAENSFNSSAKGDLKELFLAGNITEGKAINALVTFFGMTEEEADLQIETYNWEKQGFEGTTTAAVRDYNEHCAADNVPRDIYLHIRKFSNNTENDVDEETGRSINYSAMKKVMAEIHAQRLTDAQKTAVARSLGWSEKNIKKYKLW